MSQRERSQIAPPIWHLTESGTKIIIVIDKQKLWERVLVYHHRVISFFRSQRMSERCDQHAAYMCRAFLGGLRESILNGVLRRSLPNVTLEVASVLAHQVELTALHYWEPGYATSFEYFGLFNCHSGRPGEVEAGLAAQPGVGTDGVSGDNAIALDEVSGIVWNDPDDPVEKDGVDRTVEKVVATHAAEGDTVAATPAPAPAPTPAAFSAPDALFGAPKPFLIQDGIEFFGVPNVRIDKMFNEPSIVVLYR